MLFSKQMFNFAALGKTLLKQNPQKVPCSAPTTDMTDLFEGSTQEWQVI